MSFEKLLENDSLRAEFNIARYSRNFKERQHISKNRLDPPVSTSKYIELKDYFKQKYDDVSGFRNVVALSISYDLLLSIFDGNSKSLFVYRFTEWSQEFGARLIADLHTLREPNLELRLMGMQNGQSWAVITEIVPFILKHRLPVFEVDLFGSDVRHVCIDAKTGMTLNVLVNNKLYKPGELANKATIEQFQRGGTDV